MINLEFIANEIQFARKAWNVYFWSCCSDRSGFEVEHEHQELFISNLYPAILVRVVESESTSQSLQIQRKEIVMDSDNYSILLSVILMCISEYKSMDIPLIVSYVLLIWNHHLCIQSLSQLIWNVCTVNEQVWNYGYSSEKGNFVVCHWPGAPHSTGWNRQRPQCPALVCQTSWSVFHRICLTVCNLQKENWQNVHQIFTS